MIQIPNQYNPSQITNGLHYQEIKASRHLEHYIVCFWRIENRSAQVHLFPIIPDGTVDLVGDLFGDWRIKVTPSQLTTAYLPLPPFSTVWGIRFFPSVFTSLFNIPMEELSSTNFLNFSEIKTSKAFAFLSEQMSGYYDMEQKKRVFESALETHLGIKNPKTDTRFLNILNEIYATNGNIRVEKELQWGISPRQLRRVFNEYIGFSPKTFSKIVQVQHAVQGLRKPDYSYFDSGFYDQAHFIREIKAFTGMSPRHLKSALLG